jgi:hypothetical protein
MKSGFLKLNVRDFLRGLVVSVLSAFFAGLLKLFEAGPFIFDWPTFQPIVFVAIVAALGYLTTNLFTNNVGEILTKDK